MRIPYGWNSYRYIDYHQTTDWACGFMSLSPYNECFIWDELDISPRTNTTLIIAQRIAEISENYRFRFDVIDPLANVQQTNTTRTTIQDLNDYFVQFKRNGICEGAYWQPADTKSQRGREKIKERLFNSAMVKKPFCNEVVKDGVKSYLPTLWVFSNCKQVRLSLKNWREEKGKPSNDYSHHCTGIEFVMKDQKFAPPPLMVEKPRERAKIRYFQRVA